MYKESVETGELNNLNYLFNAGPFVVEPLYQIIKANSKGKVSISLTSEDSGSIEEVLEIAPTQGEVQRIKIRADVQDVHIALNRHFIEYPQLYVNKVYAIEREPQLIKIRNLGNIASRFRWVLPVNNDIINTVIDPAEGIVQPKSDVDIRIKFSVKLFGKFTFYYRCDFDNLSFPLGFELTGTVFGLDILYENMPVVDELALSRKKNLKKMQMNLSITDKTGKSSLNSVVPSIQELPPGAPFTRLDFHNLSINKPFEYFFKIKNLSGIPTYFRLYFKDYDASMMKKHGTTLPSAILDSSPSNAGGNEMSFSRNKPSSKHFSINSDTVNKNKTSTFQIKKAKLLSNEVEATHVFYSEEGRKATLEKLAQKEAEEYLQIGKGLALVCEPTEGNLKANNEITIKVKAYNELSGVFSDLLCCDIKGLETAIFPVSIVVRGSPLKIPTDQVGLKIQSDPPLLDFGGQLKDARPLEKFLKLENIGTQPLVVGRLIVTRTKDIQYRRVGQDERPV